MRPSLPPVLADEACFDAVLNGMLALRRGKPTEPVKQLLTLREDQVTQLLSTGLNNQQIARKLFISVRSVEAHLLNARRKLGASHRRELAKLVQNRRR